MALAVPIFREGWVKTNLNAWNGESFLTYFIKSFSDTHLKHLSHQSRSGINEKFTLTVVLGLLLTVFLVLCLGLIIYICKDRTKRKNSPSPSFESEQHQQMVSNSKVHVFLEGHKMMKSSPSIWHLPYYIYQKDWRFFSIFVAFLENINFMVIKVLHPK